MLNKYLIQQTRIIKLFITFMFVVLLCSCGGGAAFNRTENIQSVWPAINYSTDKHILIQVVDKRPDVLSKKVNPTYVGMMRGGFGNPFNMNTESGQPLANDVAIAINNGFRNSGIKSDIFNGSSPNSQNKSKYRRLVLAIYEWECDYFKTADFKYNLALSVVDANGEVLASVTNLNIDEKNITVQSPIDAGRSALSNIMHRESIINALR